MYNGTMPKPITGEYIARKLKTKDVYAYLDEHNDVKRDVVKEVYT